MMRALAGLAAAAIAAVLAGNGVAAAQGTEPAELPPAGFSGNQYVDSQGCVFLRAGLGGTTTWVPRLGRDRKPVCGYAPTLAGGAAAQAAAKPAPAAPAAATKPAPAKASEAAPEVQPAPAASPGVPAAKKARATAKPATTTALVVSKPVAPGATYCSGRAGDAQRYLLSDGRRVTRCAKAMDGAVDYLNGLGAPGLVVSDRAPTEREARGALAAEAGAYRVIWSRGKLDVKAEAAVSDAKQGAYIQIGAFADPANADRAMQRLEGLGLPASSSSGRLKVILAGPFASQADLSGALTLLRQNGYGDAFPTRG